MNLTARRILQDAGADPDAPSDEARSAHGLENLIALQTSRWLKCIGEFCAWASLQPTKLEGNLPATELYPLIFGHGERAAKAVAEAWRDELLSREGLLYYEANDRLEALRRLVFEARRRGVVPWDLSGLRNIAPEETADQARRRLSVSVPAELDDWIREQEDETISAVVTLAVQRLRESREAERAAKPKRGRGVPATAEEGVRA